MSIKGDYMLKIKTVLTGKNVSYSSLLKICVFWFFSILIWEDSENGNQEWVRRKLNHSLVIDGLVDCLENIV